MRYLSITNKGVCPIEGFTLLGCSTTRTSQTAGTIGQFGSGTKYAITLLIRKNIPPVVFCGKLRLEFNTERRTINDNLTEIDVAQIVCRITGKDDFGKTYNRNENLGWTTDMGRYDWTNTSMALRELFSNAIDRTLREGLKLDHLKIEVVKEKSVRAKDGYTRVFIPFTEEVSTYYSQIDKRFLHWSKDFDKVILPKVARAIKDEKAPMIYRKGVFVRQPDVKFPSLFDYNLTNLELDECRNANDYATKAHAAYQMRFADTAIRNRICKALKNGEKTWETEEFSVYNLAESYNLLEEHKTNWKQSWDTICGETAVIATGVEGVNTFIEGKGYTPIIVSSEAWRKFLHLCGVKTEDEVLTKNELNGIQHQEPTQDMITALDLVWELFKTEGLTNDFDKPRLRRFRKLTNAGARTLGFYENGEVFIHDDIANGISKNLLQTTLEEVVHYVTGAGDNSRDIQEFAFNLIVNLAFKGLFDN